MQQPGLISICIPAYKRIDFLQRLLESIAIQKYHNYEVIVSDDSPGDEVQKLVEQFKSRFPSIVYHKNEKALGTPANWNEAIKHAKGDWIKIMHDDDWFSTPESLQRFFDVAKREGPAMIFSAYFDVFLSGGKQKKIVPPAFRFRLLRKEPVTLLSRNIIGPPSVVMYPNDGLHSYDPRLKWLVDIDMYVRRLQQHKIVYLPEPLIRVGIGQEQVTASVQRDPSVQVPEQFLFLEKTGIRKLKNVLVYDHWWRFFRNFSIHSVQDIRKYGYHGEVHPVLLRMIARQNKLSRFFLRTGVFSKAIMFIHYCINRRKIN